MTVAVYVRVSTQRQAQAQTIEQQLERLRARAALAVLEGRAREQGDEPQPWLRLAAEVIDEVWPV